MNKSLYTFLFFVIAGYTVGGQQVVPTPDDLYNDAMEFMQSDDYYDALGVLLSLHKRGYQTANISYRIGHCYLNIPGQKTRAIPFLKDAVRNISVNYSGNSLREEYAPDKSLLYLGIAYRLNYDFDSAVLYFNNYLRCFDNTDRENIRLAEYHIERCNYARELIAAPATFTSDTLEQVINLTMSGFNPVVTADESTMLYMRQLKFYDAVMIASNSDGGWTVPLNMTPALKSDGDHHITGISTDGTKALFTCYDPYSAGDIYEAEYANGKWTSLQKFGNAVNTLFNETHASYSPDGNTLYFTSDRKGGYGGTDIYRSVKNESGEWGKPVNLGPLINTPYNEETPFVSSDGSKLFFSSQGHYNMGGFDIFCSERDDMGNWLPPVNIGYPLNTTDDDLFFFPLGNGSIAYQARFSGSTSQTRIIRFDIKAFGKPERFMINGKMDIESDAGLNASSLSVAFIDRETNDTVAVKTLNEDASFRQRLHAGTYKLDFSDGTKQLLSSTIDIPEYFPHNNLVFREKLIIPSGKPAKETLRIRDILFGFDTSISGKEYAGDIEALARIIARYPGITVKLNGYADAIGNSRYNLLLSRRRAESIKKILERLTGNSDIEIAAFGENNPVAPNTKPDGSDNPEGRRFNRRVEIVLGNIPETLEAIRVIEVPEQLRIKN